MLPTSIALRNNFKAPEADVQLESPGPEALDFPMSQAASLEVKKHIFLAFAVWLDVGDSKKPHSGQKCCLA